MLTRWPCRSWTSRRYSGGALGGCRSTQAWSLSWRDRNLRFHAYDLLAPSRRVEDLLAEIDRDPTGIFWG